jgi:guanylate cyclase
MTQSFKNIYTALLRFGTNPSDNDDTRTGKIILAIGSLLGIAYALLIGVYLFARGEMRGGAMMILFVIVAIAIQIIATIGKISLQWWSGFLGAAVLGTQFSFTIIRGGFYDTGYALPMWGLTAPLVALVNLKPRQAAYWMLLYLASIFIVFLLNPYLHTTTYFSSQELNFFAFLNILLGSIFIFGFLIFFILQRNEALRLLSIEEEKTEKLLLNILPHEIAVRLKNESGIIVNHFPSASILFADVVNFTPCPR